jgi:hypothetical protein
MSYVTTVVIFGRYIPSAVQDMLEAGYHDGERQVSFGCLSDNRRHDQSDPAVSSPWDFWGGTKVPESDLFGGAFNYLNEERLVEWLRTLPWFGRVAVLVGDQEEEEGFRMVTLGEGSNDE